MLPVVFTILSARTIHECRREASEAEVRRGFSQVRPTQVYLQSVEEAEREKPRRARESDVGTGIHEWSGLGTAQHRRPYGFYIGGGLEIK